MFLTVLVFASSSVSANEFGNQLMERTDVEKPEGQGPFPVVVFVSGRSGFKWPFYDRAQAKLLTEGFVIARVDFIKAHKKDGISYLASHKQVAADILFVVDQLSKLEFVKKSSINVLGWSYGGGGVLQSLTAKESRPDIQIASVATYSPACGLINPWTTDTPALLLLGGEDAPAICRKLVESSPAKDYVTIEEYEGAYHGFEDSDLPPKLITSHGTMGYHPEAAEKAWNALRKFFIR